MQIFINYPLILLIILLTVGFLLGILIYHLLKNSTHRAFDIENEVIDQKLKMPIYILTSMTLTRLFGDFEALGHALSFYFSKGNFILIVLSLTWLIIRLFSVSTLIFADKFDTKKEDNLNERRIATQFNYVKKIFNVLAWIVAFSIILMSFDEVRKIGVSILASAGITGLVLGFAAQKTISNLLAGFQIAFTQPIRIDDVVIVENEWGKIEEITLTYVVIKIWDERRLITPLTYFLEKPFQNWTRNKSELLGSVFLWVDYSFPIEPLREELKRLAELNPLWDKRVQVLQVVETSEKSMQLRMLVSAEDAPKAFDLRCEIREGLIVYIQKNHPDTFPKFRIDK
jgi:small-conductance mechanosensitive channel